MRRRAGCGARQPQSGRVGLVTNDRALGHERADDRGGRLGGQFAVGRQVRGRSCLQQQHGVWCDEIGQRRECTGHVISGLSQHVHLTARRQRRAWLARIGEERDRRTRPGEDEQGRISQLVGCELHQVGKTVNFRDPRAALVPRRERLGQHVRTCRGGDPARGLDRGSAQARSAEQDGGRPAGVAHLAQGVDDASDYGVRTGNGLGTTGSAPSVQVTSAGRIRVAT